MCVLSGYAPQKILYRTQGQVLGSMYADPINAKKMIQESTTLILKLKIQSKVPQITQNNETSQKTSKTSLAL